MNSEACGTVSVSIDPKPTMRAWETNFVVPLHPNGKPFTGARFGDHHKLVVRAQREGEKVLDWLAAHRPELTSGLAIDAGAHVGGWTRILLSRFDRVIAIEAVPESVVALRQNVPGAEIIESAICDRDGDTTIWVHSESGLAHNPPKLGVVAYELNTRSITLDSLNEKPKFLKIDVDGMDLLVMLGAGRTIRENRPAIFIEVKCGPREIRDHLRGLKYKPAEGDGIKDGAFGVNELWLPS